MKKKRGMLVVLLCGITLSLFSQNILPGYHIIRKMHLEGNGGWDYLKTNSAGDQLFVSHGMVVQVVSLASGGVIATIPDTRGVHGIALAEKLRKGYISNGKDSSVTVFDLESFKTLKKIPVTGKNPDCILFDSWSSRIFVFNGRSHNVTVIDPATDRIVRTIPLEGKPEFAVSDQAGKIFVNIEDKNTVVVLDARYLTFERSWPLAPGENPTGLAFDPDRRRLFSACSNGLMIVMDAKNGQLIATLPIGMETDGAAWDPVLKRAYSSNGEGTLSIIEETDGHYRFAGNIPTQPGARTIAINPVNRHLYLPVADFGDVPEPSEQNPYQKPAIKEGTFRVLEIAPGN